MCTTESLLYFGQELGGVQQSVDVHSEYESHWLPQFKSHLKPSELTVSKISW